MKTEGLDRGRIDDIRRLLLDAFMTQDYDTYARCVSELEDLIGVPHGDRNPKAHGAAVVNARDTRKSHLAKALKFRWGTRSLDAELHQDGSMQYSINYGKKDA